MSKSKASKRKRAAQQDQPNKLAKAHPAVEPTSTITPPPDETSTTWEPTALDVVADDDELETTIETLTTLARYPKLIKSKACKDLRVAVYDFRQACTTGVNTGGMSCSATRPNGASL